MSNNGSIRSCPMGMVLLTCPKGLPTSSMKFLICPMRFLTCPIKLNEVRPVYISVCPWISLWKVGIERRVEVLTSLNNYFWWSPNTPFTACHCGYWLLSTCFQVESLFSSHQDPGLWMFSRGGGGHRSSVCGSASSHTTVDISVKVMSFYCVYWGEGGCTLHQLWM